MQQLEIEYFWTLTEQIPLDLDYTQSPVTYSVSANGIGITTSSTSIDSSKIEATKFILMPTPNYVGYWSISEGQMKVFQKKKPRWLTRYIGKVFFEWEWKDNE